MTVAEQQSADRSSPAEAGAAPAGTGRGREAATVVAVAVLVAALALLPLIRNHIFYYWDDSAAAFLPDWYHIGSQLRAGHWPVLAPDLWAGGNLAGEAMLGLFNPVCLAEDLLVSALPDLAWAAVIVKVQFLALLGVGTYLLARDFGARRGPAAAVAVALPVAGYTLYFDASTWAGGLLGFAWLPLFWWATRRLARGVTNPLVPIVLGYLAMTVGSPYGALGVVVVLLAVAVEAALRRRWRSVLPVVAAGVLVGVTSLVVYLPLVGAAPVSWRAGSGAGNDGEFVPHLSDLLASAAPTYQPQFATFGPLVVTFPVAYLAWFVVPLLPWLSWSKLGRGTARRASLVVFGVVFLLFWLGPSNLWLFRWPARLTEYVYLPLGVVFAVLLSRGLTTTRPGRRTLATVLLVLAGGYLSWAASPTLLGWHLVATALVLVLLGGVALAHRRRPGLVPAVLVAGSAAVLAVQAVVYPANGNVTSWLFPHDVAAMRANYGARYHGNTLEIADMQPMMQAGVPIGPSGSWRDLLFGSALHVAGVSSLNAYTGIGNVPFNNALCMNYYGGTCAAAYPALWQTQPGMGVNLADALRLQTVVVLNGYRTPPPAGHGAAPVLAEGYLDPTAPPLTPPAGWSVAQRTALVTVLRRDRPLLWPDGRLSWSAGGLRVTADRTTAPTGERLTYQGTGRVVFAMLDWPGWQATVDGHAVPVRRGAAGLIEVDLPPAAAGGSTLTLGYQAPGFRLGLPLAGVGGVAAIGYGIGWAVLRRRRRRGGPDRTDQPSTPSARA